MTGANTASLESLRSGGEEAGGAAIWRRAMIAVGLSLAVRLIWSSMAHVTPFSDFAAYDHYAWKWLSTGRFEGAFRTPGYPGFLAAIYWLFGHSVRAAQIVQASIGAITSGLVVLLAGRVASPRTAGIAGVVHALWPTSIVYVAILASENVATPLLVGVLLAVTSEGASWRRRAWGTGLGGVLFALLLLVRPACVAFLPAVALLAVWEPRRGRLSLKPALVCAAAGLVTMAPWMMHNYRSGLGVATIATTGGVNLWMGNSDSARTGGYGGGYSAAQEAGFASEEKERDEDLKAEGLRWIVGHPGRYLALCAVRTARMWGTTADGIAARFLWPTAANDALLVSSDGRRYPDEQTRTASHELIAGHRALLRWTRVVLAPLMLLAFALCLRSFRRYAPVTLPVLCYAGFLAATYFLERLRELSNPLVLVSLAILLSDLALGTAELPGSRRMKVSLAAAAVAVSVVLRITHWDSSLYRL